MSDNTKIEWADATWNPWIGCTKVSPGCEHCYAATYGKRFGVEWGPGKKRRRTSAAYWKKPLAWNNRSQFCAHRLRIFPSLCDPFDPEVPIQWLADFLDLIRRTPNIDWLLLTKRPHAWRDRVGQVKPGDMAGVKWGMKWLNGEPPHNVWLGVSAEDQQRWDERVPVLLSIPAAKRFVSVEPMLGPIDMGWPVVPPWPDWIIFGGESGPKARSCKVDWIRDGVRQCREAGVKAFVKQDSGLKAGMQGRIDDETWKVKEFPTP